jgi:hypothetical protein
MNSNHPNLGISSVQTALKNYRDSIGKETNPYHFINEIRLIRYALTGDGRRHCDFNNLHREQQHVLRRVICLNRRLIKLHVDYKLRKHACRYLVLKHMSNK